MLGWSRDEWRAYLCDFLFLGGIMLVSLILSALLFFVGSRLIGAPVPPEPRELDPAALVGHWRYGYGERADGRMSLFADGSYVAWHECGGTVFFGRWWAAGRALVLLECHLSSATGLVNGPVRYEFRFPAGTAGTCNGVPVRLSGRTPIAED